MCNYNHALIPRIRPLASFRVLSSSSSSPSFLFLSSAGTRRVYFLARICSRPPPLLRKASTTHHPKRLAIAMETAGWRGKRGEIASASLERQIKSSLILFLDLGRWVGEEEAARWRRASFPISCLQFSRLVKKRPDCSEEGRSTCGRATRAEVIPDRRRITTARSVKGWPEATVL